VLVASVVCWFCIAVSVVVGSVLDGWSFSDGLENKKRRVYRYFEKLGSLISDDFITVSKYDKRLSLSYNIGTESRTRVIHNGVPKIETTFLAKANEKIPTIIMIAGFRKQKVYKSEYFYECF